MLILIIGHHSAARVVHYLRIYNSADKASYRCLIGEKSPKKSWNLSLDPAHLKSGNCHLNQLQLPAESLMVSPRYLFCARPSQQLIQRMPRECSLLRNGTVVSNAQGSTAQTRRHYFALNCGWPSPFPLRPNIRMPEIPCGPDSRPDALSGSNHPGSAESTEYETPAFASCLALHTGFSFEDEPPPARRFRPT